MQIRTRLTWLAALGLAWLLLASLAGPTAWAADGVAPFGQTVPTRTPTAAPVTPTTTPTPQPTTASTPTGRVTSATAAAPMLLPIAGGGASADSVAPAAALFVIGLGVFAWAGGRSRRQRRVRG